jgi:hypothetical protein
MTFPNDLPENAEPEEIPMALPEKIPMALPVEGPARSAMVHVLAIVHFIIASVWLLLAANMGVLFCCLESATLPAVYSFLHMHSVSNKEPPSPTTQREFGMFFLTVIGVVLIVMAVYLVLGFGLLARRRWSRIATLIVAPLFLCAHVAVFLVSALQGDFHPQSLVWLFLTSSYVIVTYLVLLSPEYKAEFS